jgi:hypothetical protein
MERDFQIPMTSNETRSSTPSEQALHVHGRIPAAMQLAWAATFLLWRGYYFFTVVVIPALGWR